MPIRTALVSVSDKSGLVPFARALAARGVSILSSGGTAKALAAEGIPVETVESYTGSPEVMDGRVKTLHPRVHGGILSRGESRPAATSSGSAAREIDLVVVNLYPFERAAADPASSHEHIIENIDIGGPSMVRSAAKNHARVTVVCDPGDYGRVLDEIGAARRHVARDARRARGQGVRAHRRLRRGDQRVPLVARRRRRAHALPDVPHAALRARVRPALRREPAPGGRVLRRARRARPGRSRAPRASGPAARSSASTTSSTSTPRSTRCASSTGRRRSSSSTPTRAGSRSARLARRGVPGGARGGPAQRVRRHRRAQPRRSTRRPRRSSPRRSSSASSRRRSRRRRSRCFARRRTCASWRRAAGSAADHAALTSTSASAAASWCRTATPRRRAR